MLDWNSTMLADLAQCIIKISSYTIRINNNYCAWFCATGSFLFPLPYNTMYWRGINIGDWQFFRKFAIISNYTDTPTKPLLKMKNLEKKDMIAQIAIIKSTNCFSQTYSPNIILANKYSCTVFTLLSSTLAIIHNDLQANGYTHK